jgi:hypothetical protein
MAVKQKWLKPGLIFITVIVAATGKQVLNIDTN